MQDGKHVILCVDDDPDILEYLQIVGRPPLEGEFAAEAGRSPGGDQRGLDRKGAGTAHGIEQRLGAVVPRQKIIS